MWPFTVHLLWLSILALELFFSKLRVSCEPFILPILLIIHRNTKAVVTNHLVMQH